MLKDQERLQLHDLPLQGMAELHALPTPTVPASAVLLRQQLLCELHLIWGLER